jgi:tRNA(fMet)-specific endonuclease VapC
MADKVILVDTSILIDYYRKTDKANTIWMGLVKQGYEFVISAITKYELFSGATESQLTFWNDVLQIVSVIPFDSSCVDTAVTINQQLKRKQIAIADLFIAATAVNIGLPIATLNKKHFERVDELIIVE